jgi:hypothetical protein
LNIRPLYSSLREKRYAKIAGREAGNQDRRPEAKVRARPEDLEEKNYHHPHAGPSIDNRTNARALSPHRPGTRVTQPFHLCTRHGIAALDDEDNGGCAPSYTFTIRRVGIAAPQFPSPVRIRGCGGKSGRALGGTCEASYHGVNMPSAAQDGRYALTAEAQRGGEASGDEGG